MAAMLGFRVYPWNLLLHGMVVSDLSKSLCLGPHSNVWSEDPLTGARMILVIICGVCLQTFRTKVLKQNDTLCFRIGKRVCGPF